MGWSGLYTEMMQKEAWPNATKAYEFIKATLLIELRMRRLCSGHDSFESDEVSTWA
jgi:hypothetical protein